MYICVYLFNNISMHKQMHTHMKQNPKAHTHGYSQNDHATHTAPHISPATYRIRRARSGRVRLQQRQHHLWPGLIRSCIMQRQLARLRKRRHRATSARHIQAGTLLFPAVLVILCDWKI